MINMFKEMVECAYYYRVDTANGVPYWKDKTLIGAVIALVCMALVKWTGIDISTDTQLALAGAIVGIGAAISPHSGIKEKPVVTAPTTPVINMDVDHGRS